MSSINLSLSSLPLASTSSSNTENLQTLEMYVERQVRENFYSNNPELEKELVEDFVRVYYKDGSLIISWDRTSLELSLLAECFKFSCKDAVLYLLKYQQVLSSQAHSFITEKEKVQAQKVIAALLLEILSPEVRAYPSEVFLYFLHLAELHLAVFQEGHRPTFNAFNAVIRGTSVITKHPEKIISLLKDLNKLLPLPMNEDLAVSFYVKEILFSLKAEKGMLSQNPLRNFPELYPFIEEILINHKEPLLILTLWFFKKNELSSLQEADKQTVLAIALKQVKEAFLIHPKLAQELLFLIYDHLSESDQVSFLMFYLSDNHQIFSVSQFLYDKYLHTKNSADKEALLIAFFDMIVNQAKDSESFEALYMLFDSLKKDSCFLKPYLVHFPLLLKRIEKEDSLKKIWERLKEVSYKYQDVSKEEEQREIKKFISFFIQRLYENEEMHPFCLEVLTSFSKISFLAKDPAFGLTTYMRLVFTTNRKKPLALLKVYEEKLELIKKLHPEEFKAVFQVFMDALASYKDEKVDAILASMLPIVQEGHFLAFKEVLAPHIDSFKLSGNQKLKEALYAFYSSPELKDDPELPGLIEELGRRCKVVAASHPKEKVVVPKAASPSNQEIYKLIASDTPITTIYEVEETIHYISKISLKSEVSCKFLQKHFVSLKERIFAFLEREGKVTLIFLHSQGEFLSFLEEAKRKTQEIPVNSYICALYEFHRELFFLILKKDNPDLAPKAFIGIFTLIKEGLARKIFKEQDVFEILRNLIPFAITSETLTSNCEHYLADIFSNNNISPALSFFVSIYAVQKILEIFETSTLKSKLFCSAVRYFKGSLAFFKTVNYQRITFNEEAFSIEDFQVLGIALVENGEKFEQTSSEGVALRSFLEQNTSLEQTTKRHNFIAIWEEECKKLQTVVEALDFSCESSFIKAASLFLSSLKKAKEEGTDLDTSCIDYFGIGYEIFAFGLGFALRKPKETINILMELAEIVACLNFTEGSTNWVDSLNIKERERRVNALAKAVAIAELSGLTLEPARIEEAMAEEEVRFLINGGEFERAALATEKLPLKQDMRAVFFNEIGASHFYKEDNQKALKCFLKAIKCDPKSLAIVRNLGYVYAKLGQWDLALKYFTLYAKENQGDLPIWKNIGNIYVEKEDWKRAISCFTKAYDAFKDNPVFLVTLCTAYLKTNDLEACYKDLLRMAEGLKAVMLDIWKQLGDAYFNQKNFKRAEICYTYASSAYRKNASFVCNFAQTKIELKKYNTATQQLHQALALFPNNGVIKKLAKTLNQKIELTRMNKEG